MSVISLSNLLQTTPIQGTSGVRGIRGSQGTQGTQGTVGEQGTQGITGAQGASNVPSAGDAKTSSYTLQTSDVGDFVTVNTGGSITIPNNTFSPGDVIVIFNNTTGNITITCTITTAYIGGTDTDKATVTLATRGIATILFISGTVCVITGNVS